MLLLLFCSTKQLRGVRAFVRQVINLRPAADSASPDQDMEIVRQWLHAVAAAEVVCVLPAH